HHFCSGYSSSSSFSEDGGPLTDNVVLSGVHLLFPREAELASASEAFTGGDDSRFLTCLG
ncbi:MAG: hypothetical protein WCZ49_09875, partial [Mesotoga sp.]